MKLSLLLAGLISSNLWAHDVPINEVFSFPSDHGDYIQKSKEEFVAQQREMIEGKKLKLWGIALFSGSDLFSYGIKIVTESKWSHVGMVLVDEVGQKYSYESTGSAEEILYQGVLPEVQIHLWEDVVKGYEGKISIRQFKFTNVTQNDPAVIQSYVYNRIGLSYEKKLDELLKAIVRGNKKAGVKSVFCSEEVAHFLIHLNYLTQERLDNNYLPKDFSQKEFIPLIGCSLNKEVNVKPLASSRGCIIF
jgi:hypothetical protein